MDEMAPLLSPKQLSECSGVPERTIRELVRRREIEHYRLAGRVYLTKEGFPLPHLAAPDRVCVKPGMAPACRASLVMRRADLLNFLTGDRNSCSRQPFKLHACTGQRRNSPGRRGLHWQAGRAFRKGGGSHPG